jgi:hypothetical protein
VVTVKNSSGDILGSSSHSVTIYGNYVVISRLLSPGASMNLAPNPASSEVSIEITEDNDNELSVPSLRSSTMDTKNVQEPIYLVKIVNMQGTTVYSEQKKGKKFNIPISSLQSGIYNVFISDGVTTRQKKLQVKH